MKRWFLYSGLFLSVIFSGCTNDQLSAGHSDVVVTVSGTSAFGEWERDFEGPESEVDGFIAELAEGVQTVADKFEGSIDVAVSLGGEQHEAISVSGSEVDIVPAAILAIHDITALRFGFIPKGSIHDLNATGTKDINLPCTCIGAGCCCTASTCGNIFLACEGCRTKSICAPGTQCWFEAAKEEN